MEWINLLVRSSLPLSFPGNPCEGTYKFLNESDRSRQINSNKCDATDLDGKWGWFRVSGEAGNALASSLPPSGTCNAGPRAYLVDDHPSYTVGELTLTLCVATGNNNCSSRKSLAVMNCGEFYLYDLFMIRGCSSRGWRYCTNGIGKFCCPVYWVRYNLVKLTSFSDGFKFGGICVFLSHFQFFLFGFAVLLTFLTKSSRKFLLMSSLFLRMVQVSQRFTKCYCYTHHKATAN